MALTDKRLICSDCMALFALTSYEQEERSHRGLVGKPSRCPDCHGSRERLRAARAIAPVAVSRRRY